MNTANITETRKITINNPEGLHLRVASEVVRICQRHDAKVSFSCGDCAEADGCSILSLLMLTAGEGSDITVKAKGNDAKKVIEQISSYFTNGAGI
jgi:phosphocarrier protein